MDVAVLGATDTGSAIAGHCVRAGHSVHLYDQEANVVMDVIDAIERRYGGVETDHLDETDRLDEPDRHGETDRLDEPDRLDGTTGLEAAVGDANLVVDATNEDEVGRRDLVAGVEEMIDDDTLVATSGGSLSVTAVAAGLLRPSRAIGIHIVATDDPTVMEVIVADQTTAETLDRTIEFVEGLDATPLVVRDAPGFASARLDLIHIVEAIRMVQDGVAGIQAVDQTLERGRGHPLGPLALADDIGLDRVLSSLEDLANRLDGRYDPPGLLREKVDEGTLGKKTGKGFYRWEDGERVEPAAPDPQVQPRTEVPDGPGDP